MRKKSFLKRLKAVSAGASMADMAMLLLIFFMATTSTEPPKGVEVQLPQAKVEGAEQDSLYITVTEDAVYLDSEMTTYSGLSDMLAMRSGETDRTVSITADKGLRYEKMSQVMKLLREHDFLNIVFMANPGDSYGR